MPRTFQTTRWSLVRQVKHGDEDEALQALELLCRAYWQPIYLFIRRSGRSPEDAEDLTQSFFAKLLEKASLQRADPAKGRLRAFLLTCLQRHLHDERDKALAQKRGARLLVHFHVDRLEERCAAELADDLSPDRLYQRRWALTLLETALQRLADEHRDQGKARLFETLRPYLSLRALRVANYEETAAALGMPLGTVRSHVSRLRQRWRDLVYEEVAATLEEPTLENIKAELRELREWL